ncbi:MAG: hypothetical protein QXH40_06170 [Candidatus Bathyarchaeia archaeon]
MYKKKAVLILLTILLLFISLNLASDDPTASACTIYFGKKIKFDMEISPKVPLFHPDVDGHFYPGRPKVTKYLRLINVGDLPFRICMLNATFEGDTHLADGLQIEILELGKGRREKPNLLYNGTLSNLAEGIKVYGKRAVPPKDSVTLQISVWMPATAGNEYQGLTVTAYIAITVRFPPTHDGMKC